MTMLYELMPVVCTLKPMDDPTFTLMSVAKPWMSSLPIPETSQSSIWSPVFWFSQATGLAAAAHGSAALAPVSETKEPATIPRAAAATAIGRRRRPRALGEGLVTLAAHRSPRRIPAKRSPVNAVPPVVEQVEKSAVALPCSRATLSAIGSALVL